MEKIKFVFGYDFVNDCILVIDDNGYGIYVVGIIV